MPEKSNKQVAQNLENVAQRPNAVALAGNQGTTPSVVPLPLRKAIGVATNQNQNTGKIVRPQTWRRRILALSFLLGVIVPSLFGALYFGMIASDRYASGAAFTVRSLDAGIAGTDLLSSFTGVSTSGSTTTDSYIILQFMKSRELFEKLDAEFDIDSLYGDASVDFLYRMEKGMPAEDQVEYWQSMINTSFDTSSSILTFEVQAFSADVAEKIANSIVKHAQELINNLSQEARESSVKFAKREAVTAEARLKLVRKELRDYRAETTALDPTAEATAQVQLETELERELITRRARLATLQASLSRDAPSINQLQREISSLEDQLQKRRALVRNTTKQDDNAKSSLSNILSNFERLTVEQEFAQKAYTVALASLERARVDADRQQRFLAVFQTPVRAQTAIYPERLLNSTLVVLVAFLLWGMSVLIVYSVRDHLK